MLCVVIMNQTRLSSDNIILLFFLLYIDCIIIIQLNSNKVLSYLKQFDLGYAPFSTNLHIGHSTGNSLSLYFYYYYRASHLSL